MVYLHLVLCELIHCSRTPKRPRVQRLAHHSADQAETVAWFQIHVSNRSFNSRSTSSSFLTFADLSERSPTCRNRHDGHRPESAAEQTHVPKQLLIPCRGSTEESGAGNRFLNTLLPSSPWDSKEGREASPLFSVRLQSAHGAGRDRHAESKPVILTHTASTQMLSVSSLLIGQH